MPAPVYRGRFGKEQAERLLWRAGFGPRPGEADRLARLGLRGAVHWLTHPPRVRMTGPPPRDERGRPLAPADAYGHDQLWWLDRMVRTNAAARRANDAGLARLVCDLERRRRLAAAHVLPEPDAPQERARARSGELLLDVTKDPAMLMWLSGAFNRKGAPNENYGRELMELFTLGADRGAYTEDDVREQARALTGWVGRRTSARSRSSSAPSGTTTGGRRSSASPGNFDWRDSCELCLKNPKHASFFVRKLWGYFIPDEPTASTQTRPRTHLCRPVRRPLGCRGDPLHPRLHAGPRMVKPPIVYLAGLLRARQKRVAGVAVAVLHGLRPVSSCSSPPNVAGWDDDAWLDTSTIYGRWQIVAAGHRQGPPRLRRADRCRPTPRRSSLARTRSGASRR